MQLYNRYNIPNITQKLTAILHEQRLRPNMPPGAFIREHGGKKHRYATVCTNPAGNKVIFYGRLHANEDAYTKFRREIVFLRKAMSKAAPLKKFLPHVYNSSLQKNAEWFTREYLPVPVLGTIHVTQRPLAKADVRQFVQLFLALQNIPKLSVQPIEIRGGDFYLTMAEACMKTAGKFFSGAEVRAIRHTLHASFDELSDYANHLVHGDCHPGNILYNQKSLYIIDWELLNQNNRTNDIAYFYAGLAKHRAFRQQLIRSFEQKISWKKEFRTLFPVTALFFTLNHLCSLRQNHPKELTSKEIKIVTGFCREVVKRAALGYTHLVTV